jgi:putative membrane protein
LVDWFYLGAIFDSDSIWLHWHAHLEVIIGLGALQLIYIYATGTLRIKHGLATSQDPKQTALFTLGNALIFISISSPLHILSDHYLFSAHMLQHIIITLFAPPLIIKGTPKYLISPLLKSKITLKIFRKVFNPIFAIIIFNVIFSVWHLPVLYELSVHSHWIHVTEHILFIVSALIMWWPLCSQITEIPKLSYPLQILYLFVMSLAQILVFGIVTFAPDPIYTHYIEATRIWNISPLTDQQIGGIIMKVGSGFMFMFMIVVAFFKWYDQETNNK